MRNDPTSAGAIFHSWRLLLLRLLTISLLVLTCSDVSSAYSVLTHEEIVDLLWTDAIRPLLLKKYPGLTELRNFNDFLRIYSV
jgi:hypothetical protein